MAEAALIKSLRSLNLNQNETSPCCLTLKQQTVCLHEADIKIPSPAASKGSYKKKLKKELKVLELDIISGQLNLHKLPLKILQKHKR